MKQLNVNITPEFERDLRRVMKVGGFKTKSDAVRHAIREVAQRSASTQKTDFRSWIGLALKGKPNPNPRFKSEDDLWS
jgi:Arc/MetJ-type ribon-helix-helix transcriptional regulator